MKSIAQLLRLPLFLGWWSGCLLADSQGQDVQLTGLVAMGDVQYAFFKFDPEGTLLSLKPVQAGC